jgi:hypothetical protein
VLALTYLSTATQDFAEADLLDLLQVSRRNNQAAGLTGMLLYADGHFIQTLEGEPDGVMAAFARIEADPRHRDVLVALRQESDQRVFPQWSMGFEEISEENAAALPGFTAFLDATSQRLRTAEHLGHAGIFHRIFRDQMRSGGSWARSATDR